MRRSRSIAVLLATVVAGPAVVAAAEAGRPLYDKYCAQCHGDHGNGQGDATPRVRPLPRDFTTGKYKFRTTSSGSLPTDDDLRRVIRQGLPYTSMPAWPGLTDQQVDELVDVVKSFSPAFADSSRERTPIEIPQPPASTAESVTQGRAVYEAQGCANCHGTLGRGDGTSAPTLADDWGNPIRAADLTQRWTFRGGPTAQDIFRTFSTGLNGTPMPSYADTLPVEARWQLVDYIRSLGEADSPAHQNLLRAHVVDDEIDLERAAELFGSAPAARFALVGQIMEPGRAFAPAVSSIVARAIHNRKDLAIELRWHDMRADTGGPSGPDLPVPPEEDGQPVGLAPGAATGADEGDFWGAEVAEEPAAGDGEDFWGEAAEAGPAGGSAAEFSDAVALQLPLTAPRDARKPYFIFGDATNPVDLWFVDLASKAVRSYTGRGSADVAPAAGDAIEVRTAYDRGEWTVTLKRRMRSTAAMSFVEGAFAPIAFSVWDGTNRERGNKRALSAWCHLYLEPAQRPSVAGPVARAALITLGLELFVIALVRRAHGRRPAGAAGRQQPLTAK